MLITNHVLAGALVGAATREPVTAFGLGILSHAALDLVPHWGDEATFLRVAVVDGLIGLGTMSLIAARTPRPTRIAVVSGMLGSCLPDADKPCTLFFGRSPFPKAVDAWHVRIQHESPRRMPQEILLATLGALVVRRVLSRAG